MGLKSIILSCFNGGDKYRNVQYEPLPGGIFRIVAYEANKTVTYTSLEEVAFKNNIILLKIIEKFYGSREAPKLYLPSLEISIALEPFTTGCDWSEYDDDDNFLGSGTTTWTVTDGIDYTKIFTSKDHKNTFGYKMGSGMPLPTLAAKREGELFCTPIPDTAFAKILIKGFEHQFDEEAKKLDIKKYFKDTKYSLPREPDSSQ